jgi:hypothetical protein
MSEKKDVLAGFLRIIRVFCVWKFCFLMDAGSVLQVLAGENEFLTTFPSTNYLFLFSSKPSNMFQRFGIVSTVRSLKRTSFKKSKSLLLNFSEPHPVHIKQIFSYQ